jgi:hypothetical protein
MNQSTKLIKFLLGVVFPDKLPNFLSVRLKVVFLGLSLEKNQ